VVYDPVKNERHRHAQAQRVPQRKRRASRRCDSLISTSFRHQFRHMDAYIGIFKDLMQKTAGLRRPGSAAIDLAWMAAGRYDGFFETGLKPWDIAAGCLLITEAGGMVSDCGSDLPQDQPHLRRQSISTAAAK
jgi:myo-inositol-1(or 4)-monophosphatase